MTPDNLAKHVAGLVRVAESYLDEQEAGRKMALEYVDGVMSDMPADIGRSSVVSKDVRATIKKIMPSIMRTVLSNDKIVEYLPIGPEDEDGAAQATDYVNHIVVPECEAENAIHDAIYDALTIKTGILKWSAYKMRKAEVYEFTDQTDDAVLGLIGDPENEILDHEKTEETDPDILMLDPNARRHSFKLRRVTEDTQIKLEAIPRGTFLITPNADTIEEAELVGEIMQASRSKLVAMGYDKEQVWQLKTIADKNDDGDRTAMMGDDATSESAETEEALEEVLIYEVYVKMDTDGDGIAEMHRIVYGDTGEDDSGTSGHVILGNEAVSEAPYASVVAERDPHQFEGHSIYEEQRDIQRVKTALLRATLDNIYAQNNMRPVVDYSAVVDPDSVINGGFGEPIQIKPGYSAKDVVSWQVTPFVADKSFQMLSYMDEVAKDRTGITDASGGMDAEAFQNTSATAANLMSESGIAQAEFIVRSIARGGLKKAFRGLLKLVVAHGDEARTVKIKGEWVEYNPAVWNSAMNCTINVGLGGGTKERDLATLQIILGLQRELLATLGADNPYVKPEQLYNTLSKVTETAGFPSSDPYFTSPNPEEIKAKMEAAKSAPNPEAEKIKAQMQLEQMKMQSNTAKEQAQMEADLQVKQAEITAKTQENREKLALQREQDAQAERIAMAQMDANYRMHQEKLAADVQKAQAAQFPTWGAQ